MVKAGGGGGDPWKTWGARLPHEPVKKASSGIMGRMGGGKRKMCSKGADCPFQQEMQHQMEYHHGEDAKPSKPGSTKGGAAGSSLRSFGVAGHKLGTGGGTAGTKGKKKKPSMGGAVGTGQQLGTGPGSGYVKLVKSTVASSSSSSTSSSSSSSSKSSAVTIDLT